MIERDDPIWEDVYEISTAAARRVHRKFGRWVQFDDLRSAALEYAWRRRELVEEMLVREDPVERKRGVGGLTRTLQRAAERYARKEKAVVSGYEARDEYFYTEPLIESMILVWAQDDSHSAGQILDPAELGGRRKAKPASEGGDIMAMVADVDKAMKALDPRSYGILYSRIVSGQTTEEVAEAWDLSHQRVSQLYQRAVRQVIELLGGLAP